MTDFCEKAYKRYYLAPAYLGRKLKQSLSNPAAAWHNFKSGIKFFTYLLKMA